MTIMNIMNIVNILRMKRSSLTVSHFLHYSLLFALIIHELSGKSHTKPFHILLSPQKVTSVIDFPDDGSCCNLRSFSLSLLILTATCLLRNYAPQVNRQSITAVPSCSQ